MRVIGGTARGRPITAPRLPGLRPTSDRVREAIFDILEARGLVRGATVVDLFAGSGALGIEALSRGATAVTFVESDPRACAAIDANLRATSLLVPEATVVRADVASWLTRLPRRAEPFGVALVDPPYAFEDWPALLGRLRARTLLFEHGAPVEVGEDYEVLREYRYGGTLVTLAVASTVKTATREADRPDITDEDRV